MQSSTFVQGEQSVSLDHLADALIKLDPGQRVLVAMAGPPASGKSTMSERLACLVSEAGRPATVFQMDGFHYDDAILNAKGQRARKGAPHTFDTGGFLSIVRRLADNKEDAVAVPVFDRSLELSRGSCHLIGRDVELVIVEGNYLLLDTGKWSEARAYYKKTILVTATPKTLQMRLMKRWEGAGLQPEQVRAKIEENDLPNGMLVLEKSVSPDFLLSSE